MGLFLDMDGEPPFGNSVLGVSDSHVSTVELLSGCASQLEVCGNAAITGANSGHGHPYSHRSAI